jgi:hypothetical protein
MQSVDSMNQAKQEVQSAFQAALSLAESGKRQSFAEFEQGLWTLLLVLGRTFVHLFLLHQVHRPRPVEYRHGGTAYRIEGQRNTEIGCRFGKLRFHRPIGRCPDNPRGVCDLPVDRELGLCSGFSLGVVTGITRLVAQMAYAGARSTFREIYEWAPSPRAVLRMVDSVGERARAFLEEAPAPADDGEILVVQVDGRGAPMISRNEHERRRQPHQEVKQTRRKHRRQRRKAHPRPRRTKGKKSKNSKEAVVGVMYTLKKTPDGIEGPINKRLLATFNGHEELFIWLRREADKRGYESKRTIFLADGCQHIWRLQKKYFPDAEACLDWYHLVEYLWSAGECMYPEGSDELRSWVGRQARALRRGAKKAVLAELLDMREAIPKKGPGTKGKRKRMDATIRYFKNNRERMIYRKLLRDDLDIGSGAVEGAVRNLVGMRLDGPGMRWSRHRSERVLHLRCILLNGQWSEFVRYLSVGSRLTLAAHPIPTTPHNAKKAA